MSRKNFKNVVNPYLSTPH